MKLVVSGKEYPLKEGIAKASLGDLYVLKLKSGMGVKSIMETFKTLEKSESHFDFIENIDGIQSLRSIIFLCRRAAGEHVEFEEASDVPLSEIGFIQDEPEAEAADPKATPTDSAPDDGTPEAGPMTT
ncbi:hypothetical protein [Glutamicibacter soli]